MDRVSVFCSSVRQEQENMITSGLSTCAKFIFSNMLVRLGKLFIKGIYYPKCALNAA